jgi:S-DNA-T family DNA segregation ATPase FtsK/SpoIIIE
VAQQKPAGKKPVSGGNRGKTAPPSPPPQKAADRYTVKPEFWDNILDTIPPWGDEIAAILLIVFGVVSFLSLLNVSASSDATISSAWSNALTSLFGYGAAIICAGIFGLGVIILLPKLGIVIRFPTRRILALEFAFLSLLALLHLSTGDPELRTMARMGRGGGQVGWALSSAIVSIVGTPATILFYALILLISILVVVGVNRRRIGIWLGKASQALIRLGTEIRPEPTPEPMPSATLDDALAPAVPVGQPSGAPSLALPTAAQVQRVKAFNIVRIRPEPDSLPPSLRPTPASAESEVIKPTQDAASHPLFQGAANFNAIGTVKSKPGKASGPLLVERPDGRIKRYFTVAGMKEPRHTGKRDTNLPPLDLIREVELNLPDEQEINHNVVLIENTLLEFDIDVDVVDVKVGPTVTQYAVQPFRETTSQEGETTFSRTRIRKIASLQSDLALALSAKRLRLETPVPGQSYIGIEVPNRNPSIVAMRSVYESKQYYEQWAKRKTPLHIPLGRDVSGAPVGIDLGTMPHLLIAGTTGSGKSVCIAAMAAALILDNTPENVRMVMLDPKMVELSRFNGIPHLLGPVETDSERIIGVLKWCTREMERRYKLLEEHAARNIETYNSKLGRRRKDEALPYIVIMVDEIGDLMLAFPDDTERNITRLAQMARAVGMHLVVATQRPSVDVITGLIKANVPARISFAVASGTDSRVILDSVGAETLMGRGDMLYQAPDAMAPRRIQGVFVSDDEVRALTQYWKDWYENQINEGKMQPNRTGPWERGLTRREVLAETDPMLEQAIELVIAEGEASASLIQRRLNLGYPRAARIMDLLLELGVVGELKDGGRGREVLIKPGKDPFKDLIDKRMNGGS